MLFTIPDTTTEPIQFRDLLKESEQLPAEFIQSLGEARRRVVDALTSQPSSQAIVDAVDAYMPSLLRLIHVCETAGEQSIKFKWRSVLSVGVRKSLTANLIEKPMVRGSSVYFEAIYVMLAAAFALCNMAARKAGPSPALTSDGQLNEAIDLYSRAAGIFTVIAQNWASRWTTSTPKERPPETATDGLYLLADLALFEAQLLALARAERKGMSSGTLLKLAHAAVQKIQALLPVIGKKREEDFAEPFKLYIEDGAKLQRAVLLKKFGLASHQAGNNGVAVMALTQAYNDLAQLDSASGPWKRQASENLSGTKETLNSIVLNNVTYQPVPSLEETLAQLPPPALMVTTKPYNLPEMVAVVMKAAGKKTEEEEGA